MSKFDNSDYVDVAERIVEFREKHPEGCLRPLNPEKPYDIVTVGDKTFLVVVAAAYRTPEDQTPGVGMAWEPFPGPTPFTKNSELQNAETSAWGRALVAVLAADTKRGVASADEIRARSAATTPPVPAQGNGEPTPSTAQHAATSGGAGSPDLRARVIEMGKTNGLTEAQVKTASAKAFKKSWDDLDDTQLETMLVHLEKQGSVVS